MISRHVLVRLLLRLLLAVLASVLLLRTGLI